MANNVINNPNYNYPYTGQMNNTAYPTINQPAMQTWQPMPQQNQQQPPAISSDRIWVQGENAGKSYLVAKNTEQVLWDYEKPCIYIKTVDAYGHPSMTTLDYTIRPNEEQTNQSNNDIEALKKEFDELKLELFEFMKQSKQQNNKPYKTNYRKGEQRND